MMAVMENRAGDWIETFKGVRFYPLDPRPEEILPEDIAHALSQICRFTGHTKHFYSVGQHSLLCAEYALRKKHGPAIQLMALLHDASEAYIQDISRPVKPHLMNYIDIESKLQAAIYNKFGLQHDNHIRQHEVKLIDDALLNMEARALMPIADWTIDVDDMGLCIECLPMTFVERHWLLRLDQLMLAVY